MLTLDLSRNRFQERLWKFVIGLDIAVNGLLGGHHRETLSGSAGRAVYDKWQWWGPTALWFIDCLFGQGHCWTEMVLEDERRRLEGR